MKAELLRKSIRDGKSVIEYGLQAGEMMDGLVLKQCKEGKLLGVLPMGAVYENGHNFMYAFTDKLETLEERFKDTVSQELILRSFESIAHTLVVMDEQGINLAYAVMNSGYVYMDNNAKKARLICMPVKGVKLKDEELAGFFRQILANAEYINSEDGDYVAKLLTAINKGFELKSFLRLIHGLMMDANLDIIEERISEPEAAINEAGCEVEQKPVEEATQAPVAPVIEKMLEEPMTEEISESETRKTEPVFVSEPIVTEPPVALEPTTPVVATVEAVIPDTPVAEPVIAASLTPVITAVEPLMSDQPVAEPVKAESVAPVASPELVKSDEPIVSVVPTVAIIPEEEIEFEPIPDELTAKIQRMNMQAKQALQSSQEVSSDAQPESATKPGTLPQPNPVPMPGMMPQPGSASTLGMPLQPGSASMPGMMPQPGPVPTLGMMPQPGPAPMPGMPLQPGPVPMPGMMPQSGSVPMPGAGISPQPQIMPQDAAYQQVNRIPNPHLIRVKTGEHISLPEGFFVIGKSMEGVDYVITDNMAISRIHCTILKKNGVYYVRDENSTNSTYVNGEQVLPGTEKLLLNNCKLVLGDEVFTYMLW